MAAPESYGEAANYVCPKCGAEPHQPCRSEGGQANYREPHAARRELALASVDDHEAALEEDRQRAGGEVTPTPVSDFPLTMTLRETTEGAIDLGDTMKAYAMSLRDKADALAEEAARLEDEADRLIGGGRTR